MLFHHGQISTDPLCSRIRRLVSKDLKLEQDSQVWFLRIWKRSFLKQTPSRRARREGLGTRVNRKASAAQPTFTGFKRYFFHLNLSSTMNHEMARLRAFQLFILNSHRADWFWGAGPAAAGYDFLHHQVINNAMLRMTFLALDFYQCFKERMDGNVVLNNRARLHLQCCWRQWLEEII